MAGTAVEFRTRNVTGKRVVGTLKVDGMDVELTVDELPKATDAAYRRLVGQVRDALTQALNNANGVQVRLV
jgi:hypothetical protein